MDGSIRKLRNNVAKFFLGNSVTSMGLWSWAIPGTWTKADLISQYQRYVYTIVSVIAENAAKIEFEMYTQKGSGKPILNHPFNLLMAMPNPMQSQFQFLEMHFTYMKLTGESYWYLVKPLHSNKIQEIWILRPDLMQVVIDKDDPRGLVTGYVMTKSDGTKETFEAEEIVHFKMPNPANPYYGLGPVQAAKIYIETEEYSADFVRNSIYNSGRPSGIVTFKGVISNDEFMQVKKQYKDNFSGTKNVGKTLFVKGTDGMDYQQLGMNLGDTDLKALKDMSRDDLMVMFRVSKTMMGISEGVNRANAKEGRAVFSENIIKPEMDRFIDHLNAFLIPLWGKTAFLDYKDPTMISDQDQLAEWNAGFNKWLTINDIRKARDLDPYPGGDVLYQPITNVPITATSEKTAPPAPTPSKGVKKKSKIDLTKRGIYVAMFFKTQIMWEKRYLQFMQGEFKKQKKEILDRHEKSIASDWGFDVDASKTRIIGNLTPLGMELMKATAALALELADDGDTQFTIDEGVIKYIRSRIDKLAVDTNDQTIKAIEDTIIQGYQDGDSVAMLQQRIIAVYGDAISYRAERIARTESLAASNEGALEAYKQSPMVEQKEWSAAADPCPECADLDGEIVGLNEDFSDGEDAPPDHPNAVLSGSTFAVYGKLDEMVGADYEGPAVLVKTSQGHELTIGPNHPVFTQRGFVKAKDLTKSDYLVYDNRLNTSPATVAAEPDLNKIPMVEDVFQSLLSLGSRTSIASPSHDLHGDRIFCKGEIQVIKPADGLLDNFDSSGIEQFRKNGFMGTNMKSVLLSGDSSSSFSLSAIDLPSSGLMRGSLSGYDLVHIQSIHYVEVKCKAFDATTETGIYNSNGFVVSNCRCAILPVAAEL